MSFSPFCFEAPKVFGHHAHRAHRASQSPVAIHRREHPWCNQQPKYLPCSVTITIAQRCWFGFARHIVQSWCWNTTVPGWRMRHRVCFTFPLESHFGCSDTRWMKRKDIKETAATANEFQHLSSLRRLSEIKTSTEMSSFPSTLLERLTSETAVSFHGPLNSPLLHRSENYMIINHSLAP